MAIKKDELRGSYFIATYNVTSTSSVTKLHAFALSDIEKMMIDDVEVAPAQSYTFTSIGIHKVIAIIKRTIKRMSSVFASLPNLIALDLSHLDTSNVTTFYRLIAASPYVAELNLSGLNTSNATDLSRMFALTSSGVGLLTTIDVSSFDTSNATSLERLFYYNKNLETLYLSNFDVKKVTNFSGVFQELSKLRNLNPFYNWKQGDISWKYSPLPAISVHQLIERASSVEDGAVARTLSLTPTTKTNWQNSEYYESDQAMATEKLITIQ